MYPLMLLELNPTGNSLSSHHHVHSAVDVTAYYHSLYKVFITKLLEIWTGYVSTCNISSLQESLKNYKNINSQISRNNICYCTVHTQFASLEPN